MIEVEIEGKEITIITSDGVKYDLTWKGFMEFEKAIEKIRQLVDTVHVDKAHLSIP